MRNSFLPPMPTSQIYSFGSSNDFWMPNLESFSTLDSSKINVHTNCLLSLPRLFHHGDDIEQGNLLSNTSTLGLGREVLHLPSHSTKGVYHPKRKSVDDEESMTANEKMKRRKPSPMDELTHYNNNNNNPHQVPLRRSQKIGDRITALQKLVSPYGKTDTASVLQEATLYIRLLQDQIQNQFQMLGSPYGNINIRYLQTKESEEKRTMDLRSRGLCLIPVDSIKEVTKEDSQA